MDRHATLQTVSGRVSVLSLWMGLQGMVNTNPDEDTDIVTVWVVLGRNLK